MAEKSIPNIFILLELDPDKPWSQAVFESRLQEKRRDWSRLENLPTKKGLEAKQNRSAIPELQRIAADEALSRQQAEEARRIQKGAKRDQLQEFDERLLLLQQKGHLLEEELKQLVKEFAGTLTDSEIRKRIKVPVESGSKTSRPQQAALEPTKAKGIQNKLATLGKSDLYDFLEMSPKTDRRLLLERARALYEGVQKKATKSATDTLASELSGYCLDIFKVEAEQAKYNETLRLQTYEVLLKKVEQITRVSNQVDQGQMELLLKEAKRKGLDIAEVQEMILAHAKKHGYAIFVSPSGVQAVEALQLCGYCHTMNEAGAKHCKDCGNLLREPCPRCKRVVASIDMACSACGFPCGNRSWVAVLLNDAQQAQKQRDYGMAFQYLEQAQQAWPATNAADSLMTQIQGLRGAVEPQKQAQAELLKEINKAIQEKRFYAARTLLPKLEQLVPPADPRLATYHTQIEASIREAEKEAARAPRNVEDNPDLAVRIYQGVLSICQDFEEAREVLATIPPSPPSHLRATLGAKVINLTWQASPSPGVRYTIVRKAHARPVSLKDGEQVATVSGTLYDDAGAEIGLPLFYAVFAVREGVTSREAAILAEPLLRIEKVRHVVKYVADGQVKLHWKVSANVAEVVVVRSDRAYPRSPQEGERVPLLGRDQAVDSSLQNERRYFYTIFALFKDYHGQVHSAPGVQIEATPQQPPSPIAELTIAASGPPQNRQLEIGWTTPAKGDVVLLKASKPTGLELGAVIPQQDLLKYGTLVSTTMNHLRERVEQLGFYYFLPIVLFEGMGYIGKEHQYVCVDDVSELAVQHLGHALRLQWRWPPACQEVLVAWNHQEWPTPQQPGSITDTLTRAQYDLRGYYDIAKPTQVDYYIIVFSVISQEGQRFVASGQTPDARRRVTLLSRLTLDYEIKKAWLSKKLTLHLTVSGQGTLPALLLVRKTMSLPLNKFDGEQVFRLEALATQGGHLTFELPAGTQKAQSYLKLFLEEDGLYDAVTVRHPSLERLKVF
ncbi:MAG: hypothetical protein H0T73_12385 [Ardenticatenales bacterium]|nr:hypothetical protein [Ardenticatenales bacterium]